MNKQEEYIATGTTAALSILSLSAVYFIDFQIPETIILALAPIILFGYTAQNSADGFRKPSLAALISVIFLPLGGVVAFTAITVAVMNPLISYFSSQEGFKNYYSSTALPLIIFGVLTGVMVIAAAVISPEFNENLQNETNQVVQTHTESITHFFSNDQQDMQAVENTAQSTVAITESTVVSETEEELSQQEIETIREGFDEARTEAPEEVVENIEENQETDSWRQRRIENNINDITGSFYNGKSLYSLIILSPLLFYSLQPLIGVLTAIAATIISRIQIE